MRQGSIRSKKLLLLMTALALALSCSACGGSGDDISGQISQNDDNAGVSMSGNVSPAASSAPEAPSENVEPETPSENVEPEDTPVSLGRMQGGVYTNEYMGLACELDSTWEFYTAEELQELPDNVSEMFEGTALEEGIGSQITDMKAECVDDMTSINILYQKLTMTERLAYATMSEAEIIEETLSYKDLLIESYAQAGIDVEDISMATVSFLGQERAALHTTASVDGIPYFTLQLFDYHLGQYSVTTTLSSFVDDNTEGLLDLFYKLP